MCQEINWIGNTLGVTANVFERIKLFGELGHRRVLLNQYGRIVEEEWLKNQAMRQQVALDEFVVMPDHFHGIVQFLIEGEESHSSGAEHLDRSLAKELL